MYNAKAYSPASATSALASTTIARRDPTEHDVQIEIEVVTVRETTS
jgi:alcohol dehydrogenase (NADP+)